MQKIKDFACRFRFEIFATLGAVVVLWQMLLPGYVLTLDMVFGPQMALPSYSGLSAAAFPPSYLIYLLHLVLSVWVIQKIILFLLFFSLFYLPLRFYPFLSAYGERYFVAIFFAINPFVYERLLAGQWKVLVAYAFLFPFVSLLIRFYREHSWRSILYAFGWLLAIGMFSLHFLVMDLILLALFALVMLRSWELFKPLAIGSITFAFLSLYWLIPAFTAPTISVNTFSQADWSAFSTAGDRHIGTLGNVAALYGFWGEHETWTAHFSSPKENPWLWGVSGALLAILIGLGIIKGLLDARTRLLTVWIALVGIAAFMFSTGVGESILRPFNTWLFEHVWFWRGFRDTEKWSGVLALSYALFAGLGLGYLADKAARYRKSLHIVVLGVCLLPVLYMPTMLWGFSNQLRPVQYPAVWGQANEILKQDTKCKAIFLPWHQYYTPIFNNRILTGNTSPSYFDCVIISSADAEIGDVGDAAGKSPEYYAIGAVVTSNTADPDATVKLLASYGVRYVIFTNDEVSNDPYTYPFLGSNLLHKVIDTPSLVLFEVVW